MATTAPQVVELIEGFEFNIGHEITTGTRVFIDATAQAAYTPRDLPPVGSSFDTDWPLVTLKQIKVRHKGSNPNCPKQYTCLYDSKPISALEWNAFPTAADFPTNIDIASEFLTYDNPKTTAAPDGVWQWATTPGVASTKMMDNLPIPIRELGETVTKSRYVYGADLRAYKVIADTLVGRINSVLFDVYAPYFLMFDGATLVEVTSESNQKMWRADLKFRARMVVNPATIGDQGALNWNYVYDPENGCYRKPLFGGNVARPLFASADFSPLFSVAGPAVTAGPGMPTNALGPLTPPVKAP